MFIDMEPLEIKMVDGLNEEILKNFRDKKKMKELLKEAVIYEKDEDGKRVLKIQWLDERYHSRLIFKNSKQKRVLPFNFRVIDYSTEFTPLGRAIITVTAFVAGKLGRDGRHVSKEVISEFKVYFVYVGKTKNWLLVDLENAEHQSTVLYREREEKEIELTEDFKVKFYEYLNEFSVMAGTSVSSSNSNEVKSYLKKFKRYLEVAMGGFDAYRFFKSISPVQHKYIKMYVEQLKENLDGIEDKLGLVTAVDINEMYGDEKEYYTEVIEVVSDIRNFFTPRTEKKPDKTSKSGYCPTFYYIKEIPGEMVPNAGEIERSLSYNSPDFHWSEEKEKIFIDELINYWFKGESIKDKSKSEKFVEGLERYKITYKGFDELKRKPAADAQKGFITLAVASGYNSREYLSDIKLFLDMLKND